MITKEFTEQMVKYMKSNRDTSLKEKCKKIGISVQSYYKACKRYNIDGKLGARLPKFDENQALYECFLGRFRYFRM